MAKAPAIPPPPPSALRNWFESLAFPLPSLVGASVVYAYFNWIDPTGPAFGRSFADVLVFFVVTGSLIAMSMWLALWRLHPVFSWLDRLRTGSLASDVPPEVRREVLNAPLLSAMLAVVGWSLAGVFYFAYLLWVTGLGVDQAWRVFAGIVLVGAPVAASLSFLVGEFYWRRRVPLFYPQGHLDRHGVIRVPILARLGATFLVTSMLPPMLMLVVTGGLAARLGTAPPDAPPLDAVGALLRVQGYIVVATGIVSFAMAGLVARFINRPVQALCAAMARVAAGDLEVRVPVRSTDELGELGEGFNGMVRGLKEAERARELFGRYVSPAVARQALERGIELGGEISHATAMFVDLRGFTALTQRTPAARVVELLNEYYMIVELMCDREGGVITQFLGDGLVVVFGAPLHPLPDHAWRAVRAALALQRALAERNRAAGQALQAGIGICTGGMIAGNVGAAGRVTYTIVGDAVNQAARLQVATRELGAPILVTESTRGALGASDGVVLRPRGSVPLKGIGSPVAVYAVEEGPVA